MGDNKKKYNVTDEFVEVYKYLNAVIMTDRINQLSELERYMLVALSLDNHDIKNPIVKARILEEVEKVKKQKAATSLVETLIRKKQELENKINDLTSHQSNQSNQDNKSKEFATVIIEKDNKSKEPNDNTIEDSKDNKNIDLNAIRRKKNFARKF